jgi:hypothetical protein
VFSEQGRTAANSPIKGSRRASHKRLIDAVERRTGPERVVREFPEDRTVRRFGPTNIVGVPRLCPSVMMAEFVAATDKSATLPPCCCAQSMCSPRNQGNVVNGHPPKLRKLADGRVFVNKVTGISVAHQSRHNTCTWNRCAHGESVRPPLTDECRRRRDEPWAEPNMRMCCRDIASAILQLQNFLHFMAHGRLPWPFCMRQQPRLPEQYPGLARSKARYKWLGQRWRRLDE